MRTAADLRELAAEDLRQRLTELDDQLFRLRLQKSMGQLDSPMKLRDIRRETARIRTILRERELAEPR